MQPNITWFGLPAGTEDDPICVGVQYFATVDCGPTDLVQWYSTYNPGGQTNNAPIFSNPNGRRTGVTFTASGTYYIRVSCGVAQ